MLCGVAIYLAMADNEWMIDGDEQGPPLETKTAVAINPISVPDPALLTLVRSE